MPRGEDARPALVVPDRPTKRRQEWRSSARARPRAREEYATADRVRGGWLRDDIRRYWNAQPPSLDLNWYQHGEAARYSEAGVFRWPRYAYGTLHTGITALGYAVGWAVQTVPGALAVAGLVCLLIWWPF